MKTRAHNSLASTGRGAAAGAVRSAAAMGTPGAAAVASTGTGGSVACRCIPSPAFAEASAVPGGIA